MRAALAASCALPFLLAPTLANAQASITPQPARAVEAGPIWDQQDANVKCANLALTEKSVWTGQWWTTVPGKMSVCQLVPGVMLKAFDSRGNDTGDCVFRGSGGYYLETCNAGLATQLFAVGTDGNANTLEQRVVANNSNAYECITVAAAFDAWKIGNRAAGRPCDSNNFQSKKWTVDLRAKKIIATDSPGQAVCLTALGPPTYMPPTLILGDCSKPETLTQWEIAAPQ